MMTSGEVSREKEAEVKLRRGSGKGDSCSRSQVGGGRKWEVCIVTEDEDPGLNKAKFTKRLQGCDSETGLDVTSIQTRLGQWDARKFVTTKCSYFFVEKEIQSYCSSLNRRKCKEEIQSDWSSLDRRKCKEEIQSDWSSLDRRKCKEEIQSECSSLDSRKYKARVFFTWLNSRLAIKT